MFGQMPLGKSQVKLQWQVEPYDPVNGHLFTSGELVEGTTADTYATDAATPIFIREAGLRENETYHWRMRLLYPAGNRLGQPASRWIHMPLNGWHEADFRTKVGIEMFSSSPTRLSQDTILTTTLVGVDPLPAVITYTWDFDTPDIPPVVDTPAGITQSVVSTVYPTAGVFTPTVTATYIDDEGEEVIANASNQVIIVNLTASSSSPTEVQQQTWLTATLENASPILFQWDFGDGSTGIGQTAVHTYTNTGVYTATVTSINNAISPITSTTRVTVTDQPIGGLNADNDGPTPRGQATQLTAVITSGTNITYTWDFGTPELDPLVTQEMTITQTYPAQGVYTATVTADNTVSRGSASTQVNIIDARIEELEAFCQSPTALGSTTLFTATAASGDDITYVWNPGNGSGDTVTGAQSAYVYLNTGTFTATVTASNETNTETTPISCQVLSPSVLTVSKQSSDGAVTSGGLITYTLTANNASDAILSGVVITDTLPSGVTFVSASDGGTLVGDTVRWQVGSLSAGASTDVELVVRANAVDRPATISNQFYGASANGGFVASGSSAIDVAVSPAAFLVYMPIMTRAEPQTVDLSARLSLSPNKTSFNAGEAVTIRATVTNNGNASVTGGFWVDAYINPQTTPTSATPTLKWDENCGIDPCFAVIWYVDEAIGPGESIVLNSDEGNYNVQHTRWPGWFASGTTEVYLYVDAWSDNNSRGQIGESNETNNMDSLQGLQVTGDNPLLMLLNYGEVPPRTAHPDE
jgi:uncharacterized repeat protein (TIGR01451 family)